MRKKNLALRPFLEAVTAYCQPLTKDQLQRVVLNLAEEVASAERAAFLANLTASPAKGDGPRGAGKDDNPDLLIQVEELRQEIKERIDAIEEGSFYEEDDDYGGYHDDHEAEYLGDEHKAALAGLFAEAGHLFLSGNMAAAQALYGRLFALLREIDEQDAGWLETDIDPREARARYCRCVYDMAEEKGRVAEVVAAMEVEVKTHPFADEPDNYPSLRDVMDAQGGDLPNFAAFLPAWEQALADKGCAATRLAGLRLEAAFMRGGLAAVVSLAREWQAQQPQGYLFWLKMLEDSAQWPALRDAAREALVAIPMGEEREQAARFLITAALALKDDALLLGGRRERFCSMPKARNLLPLLAEAARQQLREQELAAAITILMERKSESAFTERSLAVKALLMAGRLAEAQAVVAKAKPVGWSYDSSVAVVVAAVLHLVAGDLPDSTLTHELLLEYAGQGGIPFDFAEDDEEEEFSLAQEITRGLALVDRKAAEVARCHEWARAMGEARINHIVTNKRRHSYDRAAQVLGALAEARVAMGDRAGAEQLLRDYYQVRYNRFAAFRKEVKAVVSKSPALRGVKL